MRDVDVWPPLPLVIRNNPSEGVSDVIAVLKHSDRVDRIELFAVNSSALEKGLAAMQVPFPELKHLELTSYDETVPVIPDSFMGGSVPRLRFF